MQPATDYKALYEEKSQAYDALDLKFTGLQQELAKLKKMIFASRHERFVPEVHPSQLSLDVQAEAVAVCSVTSLILEG
jgi:predicted metal-dependent HD superfamily phosphohydrolase